MENLRARAMQRLELLTEPREVGRVDRRLDLDVARPLGPAHGRKLPPEGDAGAAATRATAARASRRDAARDSRRGAAPTCPAGTSPPAAGRQVEAARSATSPRSRPSAGRAWCHRAARR